jgi:hypothetical protein
MPPLAQATGLTQATQVLAHQDQDLRQIPDRSAEGRVEVCQLRPPFFAVRELVLEDPERFGRFDEVVRLGVSSSVVVGELDPLT